MNTEVSTNPGPCERVHTLYSLNSPQALSRIPGNVFRNNRIAGLFLKATLVIFFTYSLTQAAPEQPRSVPAEFVRQIQAQEEANHFRRPSAIFIDKTFNEIFVSDMGLNSIVVFDEYGNQRFSFTGEDHFAVPLDLAVTEDGFIYVLGSAANGRRIFVFDYDGLFLREIELKNKTGVSEPTDFAIDRERNIYLTNTREQQIDCYDYNGIYRKSIKIDDDPTQPEDQEMIIGTVTVVGDRILVPISSAGRLHIYNLDGSPVAEIGRKGNKPGELGFPVTAITYDDRLLMVLDKHRYNVVCYDLSGKFVGEFGGKGFRNGWFYHPTLLATDDNGQVYVGQIYDGRIQVCTIPEFILNAVGDETNDSELTIGDLNNADDQSTTNNKPTSQPAGAQVKEVTTHSLRVTGSPASGGPNR